MRRALSELEEDVIRQTVIRLSLHEKIVMLVILSLSGILSKVQGMEEEDVSATTGQVYSVYREICKEIGVTPLTLRRIGDLIRTLSEIELIRTLKIHGGRHGLTKAFNARR